MIENYIRTVLNSCCCVYIWSYIYTYINMHVLSYRSFFWCFFSTNPSGHTNLLCRNSPPGARRPDLLPEADLGEGDVHEILGSQMGIFQAAISGHQKTCVLFQVFLYLGNWNLTIVVYLPLFTYPRLPNTLSLEIFGPQKPTQKTKPQQVFGSLGLYMKIP